MTSEYGMRPLFQLFAMLLAGLIIGSMIQLYLIGDTSSEVAALEKPVRMLIGMMCFQLCTFAIPAIIWSRLHQHTLFAKSLVSLSFLQIVQLLGFFVALFFVANELNYLTMHFLTESGSHLISGLEDQMAIYQRLFNNPDLLWLNVLVFGLIPAISEELFFRGIVFNYLKSKLNSFTHAAVISSLFFAGMHMQIIQILPIFLLGFALTVVYHVSGKLWLAMLLHASNNVIQVLALSYNLELVWGGIWIFIPLIVAVWFYWRITFRLGRTDE